MKLSIVTTLYRSASYLEELHRRATAAARTLAGEEYEIVLVNDGSPDASLEVAMRLAEADPKILVVDLSRNFGQHKAMMTGLAHASGDRVFLLDSDLEEEPEWALAFAETMAATDSDVVYGFQESRRGAGFERWSGAWFYKLFNALTGLDIPENVTNARLMSRRYVEALLQHREREIFIAGLWHITGFRQTPYPVTKHATSESSYTLARKISMLVTSITSFSSAPLVVIFYVGVAIFLLAALAAAFEVVKWLFIARPPEGWTSVIVSVWLLGGLIISFVGVIGIYLHKIFSETKQRPYTIVRSVYAKGRDGAPRRSVVQERSRLEPTEP